MIGHRSPVSGVDAFGDELVATAGYDNQVILWDARRKAALARACHDHLANQCRFSPDGKLLVSASSDYTARVWTVPSLRLVAVMSDHDDDVEMAVFDPVGERVATSSRDGCVRIFARSGRLLRRLAGHASDVISVEWSHDGRQVVSSGDDGTVRRWSAGSGELLDTVDLGAETDTFVYDAAGRLYVGDDDGDLVLVANGSTSSFKAHRAGIKRVIAGRGPRLVTASYDGTVKVWDVAGDGSAALAHTIDVPASVWLRSMAFAGPSALVFATFGRTYATYDLARRRWDLDGVGTTPGVNSVRVVDGSVYTVGDAGVVHRDGRPVAELGSLCNFLGRLGGRVVTGGQAGMLFDATTGELLHHHRSPLNCSATFRAGGEERLLVGSYTGEGLVFRVAAGGAVEHVATVQLHDNAVKGVAANDRHLFSVCATGAAGFHAVDGLECVRLVPDAHDRIANGASVLPDGRFVSVSRDRKLRLWSIGGCQVVDTPHDHSVKCVSVGPNGRLVATGSYDGKVAAYDWVAGAWLKVERPTTSGISCLTPTERPDEFLASSYDGRVYRLAG